MECNVKILSVVSELGRMMIATHSSEQTICVIPRIDAKVIAVVVIA